MNTNSLLLSTLVFFHHGDMIPAYEFTHYPCEIDQIYITGLNEHNLYMVSDNLYFFEDEPIFILNPNYTNFELFDKESDEKVGEINIRWKNDKCNDQIAEDIEVKSDFTGIIAPETITVQQNQSVNILEDIYAYDEGTDISHSLQYEDVTTEVPGSYISTVTAESNNVELEKDIEIIVEETIVDEEEPIVNKLDLTTIIVLILVLVVIYLCVK